MLSTDDSTKPIFADMNNAIYSEDNTESIFADMDNAIYWR